MLNDNRNRFWDVWMDYKSELLSNCMRWTAGDKSAAEEMLSACLIKGFTKYSEYRNKIIDDKQWLKKLIFNVCIDEYRKRKRELEGIEKLKHDISQYYMNGIYGEESPEKIMLKEQHLSAINNSIDKLPEKTKMAFRMYVFYEMSYISISASLNITQAAARKRIQLARKHIRDSVYL